MPKVIIECKYCGEKYQDYIYGMQEIIRCRKCNSNKKDLKIKEFEETNKDVFGYEIK